MDILVNPASRLVDTLINLTNEELHLLLGVPEEIKKLREMLCSIRDVLEVAEQQQITRPDVKRWLSRLTDVMYDADDILDEYRIVAEERASQEHPPEETSLGCRILPLFACLRRAKFTHEIGFRIKDLNKRLEEISAIKSTLNLEVSDRRRMVTQVGRQTSPEVEPDIAGEAIEKDTRDLIDLLINKKADTNANVVVLAIVGIGGIGKTTLAQNIFQKIKADFQKTMWVCVSQEFEETDLLRDIIRSAVGSSGEARSNAELVTMVKDVLKDSKFLLVLDDVWDAQIWENLLRKSLQVGAVGSRVLVTTRNQRVAERMKAIHIHNVLPLPLDDSWLLLRKKVTKNAEEESDVKSLKDIGMKIVKKCHGLPLAITAIGGVLCGKLSRWEWERVERSPSWSQTGLPDGIHQALYLSYEDLPSHLRQCFLHCSLFREDSLLDPEHLTRLWIAEGFVVKLEKEEYPSLEEIAQGYLDELIQRSLLQRHAYTDGDEIHGSVFWTMHDVLRSLCHFLARGENSVITDKQLPSTSDEDSIKQRRLSIVAPNSEDIKPFLRSTQRYKSVRTLFLEVMKPLVDKESLDDEEVDDCFNNFQRLRIVRLRAIRIQSLPQSVGNLLHLRYLDLSYCIHMKALPESIASLQYLQFLLLNVCLSLHTLPEGLVNLRNLRTLDLYWAPVEKLPSGIARLEHLNVLKGAVVGSISSSSNSGSSCSLEEISQLRRLRQLSINAWGMISAKSNTNANELHRSLTALEDLRALHLFCKTEIIDSLGRPKFIVPHRPDYTEEDIERIEPIFDVALHPPSSVHEIKLDDFFGCQFPQWLMSSNINSLLPNLTNLYLSCCDRCSLLPPLGKLPNLEKLGLGLLNAVTRIGTQFFGYEKASTSDGLGHRSKIASSSPPLFPCLKRLSLILLVNLEAWDWVPEDGRTVAMPRLEELEIELCPKLLSLPEGLFRQATRLTKVTAPRVLQGERCQKKRIALPKSISIRSSGYLKLHPAGGTDSISNRNGRSRFSNPVAV